MSTPQERVREWVLAEVGYVPSYGKFNKYAEKLDRTEAYNGSKNGYDWCDVFADCAYISVFGFDTAIKMINQPKNGCGAGCQYSASYYRAANQWSDTPSIGAQIFFGSRGAEYHTGIVVGFDSYHVHTVEGNTGYGSGYSGGAVLERTYARGDSRITGYGVPRWDIAGGEAVTTTETNAYEATGELEIDGWIGVQSVTAWQKALGTYADGYISGQSIWNRSYLPNLVSVTYDEGGSDLVCAIQAKVGADVDGYMGPQTVSCMQAWLNGQGQSLDIDGYLGPLTAKAIQRTLNEGKWK